MSYLPTLATLATLGFTLVRATGGHDPSTTYQHSARYGVVLWPNAPPEVRLFDFNRYHPDLSTQEWRLRYEGPVADEAAFRALIARHFPALNTPAENYTR